MCTHATNEEQVSSNQSQQFIFGDSQSNPLTSLRCRLHSIPPPMTKENHIKPSNKNQAVAGNRTISSPCFGQHARRKNYNRRSFLSSLHDIDQLNGSVEILDQSGTRIEPNQWDLYELFLGNNDENSNLDPSCNGSNRSLFNDVFDERKSVNLSTEALPRIR